MSRTRFGNILFACIYSTSIYTVVGFGESCTDSSSCTPNSEVCVGGTCTCNTNNNYYYNGNQCDLNECAANIDNCDANASCTDTDGSYKCTCKTGYTGDGRTCTNIVECAANIDNCHANAYCTDTDGSYRCTCNTGYSGDGRTCTDINECAANTDNCHANAYCTDTDGSYRCTCNTGYTGDGRTCTDIDECAANTANCHANAYCTDTDGSYRCTCNTGYTGDGRTCTDIDDCSPNPCRNGGSCTDLVNDYSCNCKDGFSSKTCSVAALGAVCGQTGTTCQDINAVCRTTCVCKSLYYDSDGTSNIGGTCFQSKVLGKPCSSLPSECRDSYAQCLDDKCTCGSNFYDSNGFPEGGSCNHISDLKVKEISFPAGSVTTSGFKVNWTPSGFASYVNSYVIEWRLKTQDSSLNNSGSQEVESTVTSLVISTGVTAGKAYTVTVMSKNTLTQSNNPRTTSVSKEQAAKPNKPGAIDKGRSDLHASAGNPGITLYWNRPSGGVSGYKVTLSDGTNTLSLDSVSAVATFSRTWLRNGHRYNITIQAESETYESGKVVLGEEHKEEIKTVVTEPTNPRSVVCEEIYDKSIVLGWEIPSYPNGDLVRYTVNVYDSQQTNLFTNSTSGVAYTLKIEHLKPGTHYTFKVFTQNEQYLSTTSGDITCQTKAKLSDPPHDLRVSVVASRNFTVKWDKPNNTYSEETLGYVIQKREGEKCIKEIVYNCSDCIGSFQPSALENMCESSVRDVLSRTKNQLADTQLHQFLSLLPDTTYTVTAAAVNSEGRGNVATITQTTNEEVPQTPFSVEVADITSTSFLVAWSINGDRPGKTNFTVHVTADSPASSKNITVIGFETRSKLVENLEEFWSYIVSVEASTSLGSRKSLPTTKQQTLPAAPGQISDFRITDAPGGNYTQMKVTWKAPGILQRNSIIKEYKFVYYIEENSKFPQFLPHEPSDTYEYTVSVDVRPEQTYTVQVLAVNEQGQDGQKTVANKTTQAGVPVNIEYTLQVNIISAYGRTDRAQGMFSVTIVPEFFEESTNGRVRATGLLACAKNCDFSKIKTLQDFNNLKNWKQASNDGFTLYRLTYPAWLLNTYAQTPCSGRRKRAISSLIYTVGQEDCTDVAPDEYCNGPLSPNTKFLIVAVLCTNGGCLLSKEYGPFSTLPAPTSTVQDGNCTTQTVIVGVVLGLIIVIVSLYAGYVTLLIRRYRARKDYSQEHATKKENKREQLYVNELFGDRTAGVDGRPGNPATVKEPESEYSRLDDASREDRAGYDIIRAM